MARLRFFKSTRPRGRAPPSRSGAVTRKRLQKVHRSLTAQTLPSRSLVSSSVVSRDIHLHRRIETDDRVLVATTDPLAQYEGSLSFQADRLSGYTELSSMYDQYVIKQVKVEFQWGLSTGTDLTTFVPPRLNLLFDSDGYSGTVDTEMRQSGRARSIILDPRKKHVVYLKPAVRSEMYRSALTTGYGAKFDQPIDCATMDVPHYGLLWQIQKGTGGLTGSLTARITYDVEMLNTR